MWIPYSLPEPAARNCKDRAVVIRLRKAIGQVRAEPVTAEEEGLPPVMVARGVLAQPRDGPFRQEVLEGGVDRLVQDPGEQVARLAVGEGAADLAAETKAGKTALGQVSQVVVVPDGIAPARVVQPFEAVVLRSLLFPDVPLAHVTNLVAGLMEVAGEGDVPVL